MNSATIEPPQLDFLAFTEFAVAKTSAELSEADPAMRMVLALHRVASASYMMLNRRFIDPAVGACRVLSPVRTVAGWSTEAKTVASLSGMSRSAVSALVNTLERDGLITRAQSSGDRRAVTLGLTNKGRSAIVDTFTAHNRRKQTWADSLNRPSSMCS